MSKKKNSYSYSVVRQVCGVFGNLKKNENMGQLRQCRTHCTTSNQIHKEGVNSKSKVITVSLHPLGKVYQGYAVSTLDNYNRLDDINTYSYCYYISK